MPPLESYRRELDYSYAPGFFPTMEALTKRPELVRRVLISTEADKSGVLPKLLHLCADRGIRVEEADRALRRIIGKDNTYAAAVFDKQEAALSPAHNHLVLHQVSDRGNLGTMLRTALGFGYRDIAVIRPAADHYDPQVIRASMGALFSLRVSSYDSFEAYRALHPDHQLYPFMLSASVQLAEAARHAKAPHALIMGNEGSGLPEAFAALGQPVRIPHNEEIDSLNLAIAAAIGMYAFSIGAIE